MLLGDCSDEARVIHMALTQNFQRTLLSGLTLGMPIGKICSELLLKVVNFVS